jgi:hypothetical protein
VATSAADIRVAAGAAADSLEPITRATREIAQAFRRRDLGRAQADLADLFRTLRTLTVITSRLTTHLPSPGPSGDAGALYEALMRTLDEFAKRQHAEDWDAVAHLLTHDLQGVLAEWPATLRAFASRAYSGEPTDRPATTASDRREVRS